jgi:hypothetical protein
MKDIHKYPVTRRSLLGAIGLTAGSAAMYDAMLHMGYAATSDFKGPIHAFRQRQGPIGAGVGRGHRRHGRRL